MRGWLGPSHGNGSVNCPPAAEIEEASRVYLKERNAAMRLRRMREAMRLASEHGLLIEKRLAVQQISFLVIEMRQKLLSLPQRIGTRFKGRGDELATRLLPLRARWSTRLYIHWPGCPNRLSPGGLERPEE